MDWYYIDPSKPEGKRRNGPWSLRQMLGFAEQGAFVPETLVWRDGYESWKPWATVEPEVKNEFQTETIKQVIEEKILPNLTIAQANYASFWVRLCALAIDYVVIQLIFVLLTPFHSYLGVISAVSPQAMLTLEELMPTTIFILSIIFCYNSIFVKNYSGTLGKIALGIVVVRHDGKPMTWHCALLRSFLSLFFFGISHLLAAFDIEKRALHDVIANTRVLKLQRA
ncbi:MAG: RDD family protein [Fibromonadales bacterium]|nr:RDD family protein [Fibromonadales bacterium]